MKKKYILTYSGGITKFIVWCIFLNQKFSSVLFNDNNHWEGDLFVYQLNKPTLLCRFGPDLQ